MIDDSHKKHGEIMSCDEIFDMFNSISERRWSAGWLNSLMNKAWEDRRKQSPPKDNLNK